MPAPGDRVLIADRLPRQRPSVFGSDPFPPGDHGVYTGFVKMLSEQPTAM
jgi:hypothetical protein